MISLFNILIFTLLPSLFLASAVPRYPLESSRNDTKKITLSYAQTSLPPTQVLKNETGIPYFFEMPPAPTQTVEVLEYSILPKLENRVLIDDTCLTRGLGLWQRIDDALDYLPYFIEQGIARSQKIKAIYNEGFLRGGPSLAEQELKDFCPVWDSIFGTKGLNSANLEQWVKSWKLMKKVITKSVIIPSERVLITCHNRIEAVDHPGLQLCDGLTQAITFRPKEARAPSVANPSPQYPFWDRNAWVVNLCDEYFRLSSFGNSLQDFYRARNAAKATINLPTPNPGPNLPTFREVQSGALAMLHEMCHLKWTIDSPAKDDIIELNTIRTRARTDGFPFLSNKAEPNALFGVWSYLSSLSYTANCIM